MFVPIIHRAVGVANLRLHLLLAANLVSSMLLHPPIWAFEQLVIEIGSRFSIHLMQIYQQSAVNSLLYEKRFDFELMLAENWVLTWSSAKSSIRVIAFIPHSCSLSPPLLLIHLQGNVGNISMWVGLFLRFLFLGRNLDVCIFYVALIGVLNLLGFRQNFFCRKNWLTEVWKIWPIIRLV